MNFAADFDWLKHHVILLLLVVGLVIGSIYGIESVIAKHDHEKDVQMQTLAQTMVQQNQLFQQQTKAEIDTLVQQNAVLIQQNTALASAITSRDAQLRTQQSQVPQLNPDQLSVEWQKSIKNAGNIKPATGGYLVDQSAAVASLQAIEAVPVLQQDVIDLQKSNANLSVQLGNETSIFLAEQKAHASDNASNTAVIYAKDAEIKDVKAQCRKSKTKIAAIAGVIGFIVRHFVGF
jgi:hypothetical protein